jgi:hypothetical protein
MGFTRFVRRTASQTKVPIVGLQKRGTFSMNAAAVAALRAEGDLDQDGDLLVEFFYDPDEKLVGGRRRERLHRQEAAQLGVVPSCGPSFHSTPQD